MIRVFSINSVKFVTRTPTMTILQFWTEAFECMQLHMYVHTQLTLLLLVALAWPML
jgi:hypothetical protein